MFVRYRVAADSLKIRLNIKGASPIFLFAFWNSSKRFHIGPDQPRYRFGEKMTNSNASPLAEIRELNLSYLLLAQRLLQEDRPGAMFRMGLSEPIADVLGTLNLAQLVKIAASSQLLCRFRFDDHTILSSLADKERSAALAQTHAAILLSAQPAGEIG
jgi:flagellar transcriptional activator FlhD